MGALGKLLAFFVLWLIFINIWTHFPPTTIYYPGVELFGITIWPGHKARELIGYDEEQYSWPTVDRIWHENGQLYEDTKAYDEDGNEVPLKSSPRPYMTPPRLDEAFFRQVKTRWDEQGRKIFEIELRKGCVVRQTSFWPENERVHYYFDMKDASWHGTEKVFSRSGALVYEGRWQAGRFVKSVSGNPEAEERWYQAREWSRKP